MLTLVASAPLIRPVRPPMANSAMKVRANTIGGSSLIEPLYIVATQLKTLMPLGMATRNVSRENSIRAVSLMPLVNM